jgi:hypothetical protein
VTELEKTLSDARKAREEAEAAMRRAAELEAQAEVARERAEQERMQRRRVWAQRLVDSYENDIAAADAGIQQAEQRFNTAALEDLPGAVKAYIAWGEATMRHYAIQLRIAAAAPILDMDATPAEFVAPPLFSDALDQALGRHLGARADAARQEIEEQIAHIQTEAGAAELGAF